MLKTKAKKISRQRPWPQHEKKGMAKRGWPAAARQQDHLALAAAAQVAVGDARWPLNYEPLAAALPPTTDLPQVNFLGKRTAPLWISPLSLGPQSKKINAALAQVCADYKLGWMLGSLRSLLERGRQAGGLEKVSQNYHWRPVVGDIHLWGNLGISQVAQLVAAHDYQRLLELVNCLQLDGLVIHINPLQEWWQMEGDRYTQHPLDVLSKFLAATNLSVIVKEVGQGLGPWSLQRLGELPLAALDLAGLGGTNFTRLEAQRRGYDDFGMALVGHSLAEMTAMICARPLKGVKNFILSGGVAQVPPVFACYQQLKAIGASCVVAMGFSLLQQAQKSPQSLAQFVEQWLHAWMAAERFCQLARPGGHDE